MRACEMTPLTDDETVAVARTGECMVGTVPQQPLLGIVVFLGGSGWYVCVRVSF